MSDSPQIENGYTQIANELMDAIIQIRIPGEARQCLDFIIRKTYGWHKKSDAISLSQFVSATGLSKVHVCRMLNKLVVMNLITKKGKAITNIDNESGEVYEFNEHLKSKAITKLGKAITKLGKAITKKGKELGEVYEFNKHFKTWKPLPKKIKPLPNWDTTKDTSTKTKKKKKRTKKKKKKSSSISSLQDWLQNLKTNPAYQHINFEIEIGKMDAWLTLPKNKHRKKTKQFILNWINKIEKPIAIETYDPIEAFKQRNNT